MKLNIILALVTTLTVGLNSFASGSTSVKKETWTCKGDQNGISSLQIVVDHKKNAMIGSLEDFSMGTSDLSVTKGTVTEERKASGSVTLGHDDASYSVELVLTDADAAYVIEEPETKKMSGKAVVIYDRFIDCLGEAADVEVLNCTVNIAR